MPSSFHIPLSRLAGRTSEPPISWLMKLTLEHPGIISLAAGFTDNASLPLHETAEIVEALLHDSALGRPALQYGSTAGDPELRSATLQRLAELEPQSGIGTDAAWMERTLITHGSQQLLYLTTEALCDEGDIVIVEDPTYFVYLSILQSRGIRARGVRLRPDGVDTDHLREVLESIRAAGELHRVKLLYLVSYFQNPSGITCSAAHKRAALEILAEFESISRNRIYLLEDAAYRELSFTGETVPSTLGMGSDRVIYAGTYSKPFATGVRVGFGILPPELAPIILRLKGNHDFGTAHFLQRIVAKALTTGAYARHLVELRARYAEKARLLYKELRDCLPANVTFVPPEGGLYIWASFPQGNDAGKESAIFRKALEAGVLYVPGALCYAEDSSRPIPVNQMRISFGGANEKDFIEAAHRLAAGLSAAGNRA